MALQYKIIKKVAELHLAKALWSKCTTKDSNKWEEFDSSYKRKQPAVFAVNGVIRMDRGVTNDEARR